MIVQIDPQQRRRLVWLHIAPTSAMEPLGALHLIRRLNRFLVASGLFAMGQGNNRILLLGLKGSITAQDTGLVMLWLWRQPQVAAIGLVNPSSEEFQATGRLGYGEV